MKIINLNDRVEVILTANGRARLQKYYDDLNIPREHLPQLGWDHSYRTQLWDLMQIFGAEMFMGNPRLPLFEGNNITLL